MGNEEREEWIGGRCHHSLTMMLHVNPYPIGNRRVICHPLVSIIGDSMDIFQTLHLVCQKMEYLGNGMK